MKILFRTDASVLMGTGHVIRCLRFADCFRLSGIECLFVCRSHVGHLAEQIRRAGHSCLILPAESEQTYEPTTWLGADEDSDARDIVGICRGQAVNVVLVDHLAIGHRWEKTVAVGAGVRVVVIDGQANRPHHCDLLIDPTFGPGGLRRWRGLVPADSELLVGPQYHPLSPDFAKYDTGFRRSCSEAVSRILVAVGGGDHENLTGRILKALDGWITEIRVDMIIGPANPHYDELHSLADSHSLWHLHINPPNFVDLMAAADLAIGAGGTMLWERCYMQLPSVVIAVAANQECQCSHVAQAGAIVYLGRSGQVDTAMIRNTVLDLVHNSARRRELINASVQIFFSSPFVATARLKEHIITLGSFGVDS